MRDLHVRLSPAGADGLRFTKSDPRTWVIGTIGFVGPGPSREIPVLPRWDRFGVKPPSYAWPLRILILAFLCAVIAVLAGLADDVA